MAFSRIKFTIFLYHFLGHFSQQFYSKICLFFFSEFLVIRMFVKNSIFTLYILKKQLYVFARLTLHKSRQALSFMSKFTWKYITQLNSVLFINITKDLQYYILPRYAWNAVFLWIQPPREIYSTIFHLKHMKTGVPMITIRTVRAKLNKEALGKIKNTSKNDRRGCPSLLKFGQ